MNRPARPSRAAGPGPGAPVGTRTLLVGCFGPQDRQFVGIAALLAVLGRRPRCHSLVAGGASLTLRRRRLLSAVLLAGHGAEDRPRLSGTDCALTPERVQLPARAELYLLGCHQGRPELLRAWARGTGLPPQQVHGCEGETDTALSTCLLLHLLEDGVDALARWFPEWVRCNKGLRPHFTLMRRIYQSCGRDGPATLAALSEMLDLAPWEEFVEVVRRHPDYLRDIAAGSLQLSARIFFSSRSRRRMVSCARSTSPTSPSKTGEPAVVPSLRAE